MLVPAFFQNPGHQVLLAFDVTLLLVGKARMLECFRGPENVITLFLPASQIATGFD